MAEAHKNFAYSTVATAPSPATTGTSLVVSAADGAKFPPVPFNAAIWPNGQLPLTTNAEIVRVTAVATDTLTIVRQHEGTAARSVVQGDQIAEVVTAQMMCSGIVQRKLLYDLSVPDGHSIVAAREYDVGTTNFELLGDAILEVTT